MSNSIEIKKVIGMIEKGTAVLADTEVATVEDMKAICDKSLKQLMKTPELLHPFKGYVTYYVGDDKRQCYPFLNKEVEAAGEIVKDDLGEDLMWIPNGKGNHVALYSEEGLAAAEEKPHRAKVSTTRVLRIKTFPVLDLDGNLNKPETTHAEIPLNHCGAKWRGFKVRSSKQGESATDKALIAAKTRLEKATKVGDEGAMKIAQKMIDTLVKLQAKPKK